MQQGWIKLYRNINESETFKKLNAIQKLITIYIILNANHNDGFWCDKYKKINVEVKKGQLVTSRNSIKKWFDNDPAITERRIRTTLKKLEKFNFLTKETTNNYTILNIVNYETYQCEEQKTTNKTTKKRPRSDQEVTTNKNEKNEKNEKKKTYSDVVRLTDEQYQKLINEFGEGSTKNKIENLALYIKSKGKKYSCHYSTILCWERKNNPTKQETKKDVKPFKPIIELREFGS